MGAIGRHFTLAQWHPSGIRRSTPTLGLRTDMLMFASEDEVQRSLAAHDDMVRRCAEGEIAFEQFCDEYKNYWSFYALDGHESDDEEREILGRYEDQIELHRLIAFDVLGQLCSDADAEREIYIQAGRFGSGVAQQKLAALWQAHQQARSQAQTGAPG